MGILDASELDRMEELKDFDDMITGVKGLVDTGLMKIPNIFIRSADELTEDGVSFSLGDVHLPVIDLSQIQSLERRKAMVDEVKVVSSEWGFFWLVNHGVPRGLIEDMLEGIRQFNEGDVEEKKRLYSRDTMRNVIYYSNFSLYHLRSASWRDTFAVSSQVSDPLKVPVACKWEATLEYMKHMRELGDLLLELLSQALGLKP